MPTLARARRLALLALLSLASACSVKVEDLAPGALVTCAADADCPAGFFCSKALGGRCVEKGGSDQTPPSVVSSSVTPSARAGTNVVIQFEVSEPLATDPVVSFQDVAGALGEASHDGLKYKVEFPASSDMPAGPHTVVAKLVDLFGNETPTAPLGTLTLDFTSPTVSSAAFSPARAKLGSTLHADLTFSENLGAAPTLTVKDTAVTLTPSGSGNTWAFDLTLASAATLAEGPLTFVLHGADAAGNLVDATYADKVTTDYTPPTVASAQVGTPSVRAGDGFVAGVTFSEPLGTTPPMASLVPVGAGTAIPLQVSTIDASTYALSYDVPLGAANGTYTLTLVSAADRAGNPAAPGPLGAAGAVRFDSTAPAITALTPDHANRLYRRGQPVQVTFTLSEAPAADPDVRLELLPTPLAMPCTHAALAYTCTSAALAGTELPQSVVNVSVTVADPAGNVATGGTSVVLDFTNPTVLSAAPGRSAFAAGATLSYTVSVSEPLAAAPTLAVQRAGVDAPGFFGAPSAQSATTFTWSRAVPAGQDGAYTVTVAVTDEAGNAAAAVAGTGFSVDTAFPSASGITVAPAKVAFKAGDRPTLSFTTSESLSAPTAKLNTATPIGATCTPAGPATSFSCQLDRALAATDLPEGPAAFLVTLTDAAGNVGYASTALTLDYTPPALASAPATRYLGTFATRGVTVQAVGTASSWELAILSAEPLAAAPVVTAGPGTTATRTLTLASSNAPVNTSFVYTLDASATAYPAATWNVRWTPTDLAGNAPATAQNIATVDVDGVAPAAPLTGTAAAPELTWTRIPWGTDTDATPVYQLTATATSAGTDAKTVIAWDGSGAGAREVARASPSGGPPFVLTLGSDPADLWVSSLDKAGNESPRTRVVDVVWTASLAGKVPGSTFENPHRLETRTYSTKALVQTDAVEVAGSALGVRGDGLVVTTTARGYFKPVAGTANPAPRRFFAMASDPGRGVVVLFGGQLSGGGTPGDTWEWDGSAWKQVIPVDPEGDGNPPTWSNVPMAYDPVRGGVLLHTTNLWLWNGRSWKNLDQGKFNPGLQPDASMAWDVARGVLVSFGANYGNPTWEWDGTSWRDATPAAPADSPPARSYHKVAWDPVRQRVVLFGGMTLGSAFLNDTWTWDGSKWTQLTTAGTMPGRESHAMAWDPVRNELVVQGGWVAGPLKDGKTYALRTIAGTPTWVDVTPGAGPLTFAEHVATFDTRQGQVVVFGDWTGAQLQAWDGTAKSWSVLAPGDPEADGNPTYSSFSSRGDLVYVPGRGRAVYVEANQRQTWEWDRASWARKVNGAGPTARIDATIGRYGSNVILFGGSQFASSIGDTWSWDGSVWTQRLTQTPATRSPLGWYETYRQDAGMVNDLTGRLFRFGGADQYSGGIQCYSDMWELTGVITSLVWTKFPAWNDPENDGSPTSGNSLADTCFTRGLLAWDRLRNSMVFYKWPVVWEYLPASNSWRRHDMVAPLPDSRTQGVFWDTTLGAVVVLDPVRAYALDLVANSFVPLDVANVYGPVPPSDGIWTFDDGAGRAVGLEQIAWTYDSGTASGPAQVFTVDSSRANGPDPSGCVNRATCPIQRIDVSWSGGGTAPAGNGAKLQVWNGEWVDAAVNASPAVTPSLMTWTWTSASPFPASSLFHGAARELSLALVPTGATTAAGAASTATDGLSVTIRYRRP
ncbi:MAG: Ig-like domain-containing protein [Anaeromyxobacter sp.]